MNSLNSVGVFAENAQISQPSLTKRGLALWGKNGNRFRKEEFINNFSKFAVLPEVIIKNQIYCRFSYSGHIIGILARKILDSYTT